MKLPTYPITEKAVIDEKLEIFEWEEDCAEIRARRLKAEKTIDQIFEGPRMDFYPLEAPQSLRDACEGS